MLQNSAAPGQGRLQARWLLLQSGGGRGGCLPLRLAEAWRARVQAVTGLLRTLRIGIVQRASLLSVAGARTGEWRVVWAKIQGDAG